MPNALNDLSAAAPPPRRRSPGPRCGVHTAYRSLANDAERETFVDWITDRDRYRNGWIADRLRDLAENRGDSAVYVPEHTVTRHRQNRCACWERAPFLAVPNE